MDCDSGPGALHSAFTQTGPLFHAAVEFLRKGFLGSVEFVFRLDVVIRFVRGLGSVVMSPGLRSFFTEGCASTAGFDGLHLFRDGIGVEFHCGVLS